MKERKVVAIIQGRMSSSRLPGKVLLDLGGQPMLARVISRVRRARSIDEIMVATTTDPSDDPIADWCEANQINCCRGDLYDVLDRYYQAAKLARADVVVRITADCPMIDPKEIDRVVRAFFADGADFAANRLPPPFKRTSPVGMDTEVSSFEALERAWQEATLPFEREHVMPYLYDEPGRFRVKLVNHRPSLAHLRYTVDTPEDLQLAREVYAYFDNQDTFSLSDLLKANALHPAWQERVAAVEHKILQDVDARMTERVKHD